MGSADLFDLSGRHALVTGAAGLLGREFAFALGQRGAIVHLIDVNRQAVEQLAGSLVGRVPVEPRVVPLDITDEAAVEDAIGSIPWVDILVNSAAINPKVAPGQSSSGHLSDYPLARWEESLAVNLTGTFLMTRACCRTMEGQGRNGRGVVVNVSSIYGLQGPDQRIYAKEEGPEFVKPVDYSVTKAGILGLTRAVAASYRGTEIRVNSLTPGGAYAGQDDEFVKQYSSKTILDRMAVPSDFRGAITFLCSDASSYMTGANLVIDGGWTAS